MNFSRIRYLFRRFFTTFERNYPTPYKLLAGEKRTELLLPRALLLALYGLLVGFLFYRLVLVNLDLPDTVRFYFGLTVAVALGKRQKFPYNETAHQLGVFCLISTPLAAVGCSFSAQVRCVCALCWVGFFGKAGRNLLKTLTLTLLLTGPIENASLNGREVVRVLTCSAELAFNLTLTRVDLMTKPFQNALLQGRDRLPELKQEFSAIVSIVEPIVREVEHSGRGGGGGDGGEDGSDSLSSEEVSADGAGIDGPIRSAAAYQQAYVAKLNERCLAQLATGVDRCKASFERSYDECSESLPPLVNTLLCWPMKLDVACSSAELFGVGAVCRMEDVLDEDFGANYRLLKQTEHQLTGGVGSIEIDYQVPDLRNHSGYVTIKKASKQMGKEFSKKKHFLRLVSYFVRKVFAFIFLRVIFSSVRYHNAYLWRITFNNFYITDQFRALAARRVEENGFPVLPLRAIQQSELIDTRAGIWNKLELRHIVGSFATLLFHCLSTTVLLLMDALLYETLDIVARHSRIEYHQQGFHGVNVTVTGTGALAELVRNTAEGFRTNERLDFHASNKACLPRPVPLSGWTVAGIYGLFALLALLITTEAYIQRARRLICSFFYPGREQLRTAYLYNRVLRQTRTLQATLPERILQLAGSCGSCRVLPFCDRLALQHPNWFGWTRTGRRCAVCRGAGAPQECQRPDCFLCYCAGCWQDIDRQCVVCGGQPADCSNCCNPLGNLSTALSSVPDRHDVP
ncbi:protein sneaky isoform X1 [Anopheles gambiae]|uniref:protein sneaky isoform X1 n=1 Tax=Anopheles gambiae TaxID=7165 RepID=UPI002AC965EE|nr:protein sneaky isoform X1 [Anopheles gambiae]